jgi:copper chaperone CopZ
MERVRAHLQAQPGVRDVRTNPAAGSITVQYDPRARTGAEVLAMLADVGLIVREVLAAADDGLPGAGHSRASQALIGALTDLDRRLSRTTGRRIDLKLLFPAALGVLGVRQVLAEGLGLTQVPGYVLLWYAFDAFYKLHAAPAVEATASGAAAGPTAGGGA